jgi:adenine-specific DNA-methyltransferase
MNYIGSKRKLAENIFREISSRVPNGVFCDMFAGTGAVSEKFCDYDLIVNDWEDYSYYINCQKFGGAIPQNLENKIETLRSVEPLEGFIYEHYSPAGGRMYFTEQNAARIDAIRIGIEEIAENESEKIYLTALLLHAADAVANTASVYGAFLKKFKATAEKPLDFIDRPVFAKNARVYCQDAATLEVSGDVLYLDPPYNTRHYGANYHILNTITNYEEFVPKGVTGLPEYKKSDYCSKPRIKKTFEELLQKVQFEHIFISYNDEGILSPDDFSSICTKVGMLETIILDEEYQRFKADSTRKQAQNSTIEYLYYVKKG